MFYCPINKNMKNKNMYGSLIVLIAVLAVTAVYGAGSAYAREAESGGGSSVGGGSGFDSARDIAERGSGAVSSSSVDVSGFDSARDIQERGAGAVSPGVRASGFDSARDIQERGAGAVSSSPFKVSGFDSARDITEQALRTRGIDNNFHFARSMRRGMRSNDDVRALQVELGHVGVFHGSIDGSFGNITRRSVMEFQRKHGLRADGVVGSKTRGKLNEFRSARLSGMDSARDLQEVGAFRQ